MLDQPIESNVHLIACGETREAAHIDAGTFTDEMQQEIQKLGLKITQILLTHTHWDHVEALDAMRAAHPDAPLVASTAFQPDVKIVKEGDTVRVGNLNARVFKTSGHTPDSITYVFEDRVAFTGDALFAGSIGGTSSDGLRAEEIGHIREKLFSLPDACEVRCGHGPASTIGVEKAANPFFN
jgi:glyoxylase-like metal-dependent hydrolase (beta-lactamase superfamily II)